MSTDVVVAVMGMTGVGKSTFIKTITGRDDVIVGHSLASETTEVRGYSFKEGNITYHLVDTPGFDDTHVSDDVIMDRILAWLHSSYKSGVKLNGIVYLHSITSPKMQGSAFRNLRMFRKLCGADALKSVVLATTFWNEVNSGVAIQRERELIEKQVYWGKMVAKGSKVMRLGLSRNSAMSVLEAVATDSKVVLEAQQQQPEHEPESGTNMFRQYPANINTERYRWHQHRVRQQEEDKQKWDYELSQMRLKMQLQTEELERTKARTIKERERVTKNHKKREKLYKSHKCRCSLAGSARCGSCRRKVGKGGNVFYHCCFCGDDAFLHCSKCGNNCPVDNHPQMRQLETYWPCVVM